MSVNNSHYGTNGVLLYNGEIILIYYDGVELALEPDSTIPIMKGHKKGRIYLTSHRVIFVNKNLRDELLSFSMPFMHMRSLEIEQPVFGANYLKGEVKSEGAASRWSGTAKFKLWFNNGGAIEFGQCLMNAGRLANEARVAQQFTQQQVFGGDIYPAPPPAYSALSGNNNAYGWVPMDRFPDRPQGESVFMYEQPPPYTGIFKEQPNTYQFDVRQRVANGFVDPNDPNKVYMPSAPSDEKPPSYDDSIHKKKE